MNDECLDPTQFLGLPSAGPEKAEALVLPLPLEKTVSYCTGTAGGPDAIIKSTLQVEFFDEETLIDFSVRPPIYTAPPLPASCGMEEYLEEVEKSVRLYRGKFVVGLGGEHTLTYGMIRGIVEDPESLTIVHIDAHADLIDRLDGRRWSHGTVMRRISELGCRIIQIGIRSLSREEYDFLSASKRITTFFAHRMREMWPELILRLRELEGPVYLSIDIDGMDPSLAPSTGTPMPGGLSWEETLEVVRTVALSGADWLGADIVEFIPSAVLPGYGMAPARLLAKILAYRFM